jgi:hypothetical protein
VTASAFYAPPPVAVWLLSTFRTVMVLLVVVFVCVFPSCLRVSHCASATHIYLLDLFVKWSFKGVPVISVNCLGNCFVRFVFDYG